MGTALAGKANPAEPQVTSLQKRFADLWVNAKVNNLPLTAAEIAKAAGYKGANSNTLGVMANKTLNSPAVRAYLQQQAKDVLMSGQLGAAATLARLSTAAKSERVQADTAYRLAVGTGLLQAEGQAGSGSVVLQLVFRHSDGHGLASVSERPAQVIDVQGEDAGGHPPTKGTGRAKGGQQATGDHPRHPPKARAEGAGVKNPKRRPPSTPTHSSLSKTSGGGVGKSGGDAGGSSDFSGGAKSRGVKR